MATSVAVVVAELEELYATAFAGESLVHLLNWAVLTFVAVAPLLCLPFVALGCCAKKETNMLKFGERTTLRKVFIAVRADMRMGLAVKNSYHKSAFSKAAAPSDPEAAFTTKSSKALLADAKKAKDLGDKAFFKQKVAAKGSGKKGSPNACRSY